MYRFRQIFKMDLLNNFRNPILINYNTVFAVAMILILGYLSSGNYADEIDSYNYYAVTFLIFGMLEGAMTATNCFMERDIKRPNLRILYSPCGKFSVYFSKIAASFVFDYVLHAALCLVFILIGINLGGWNIGWILLMMVPTEFASASLGAFFCCVFHCEETSSSILSLSIDVFSFLGGAFFSLDRMGPTLAFASWFSPVKWLINAFFTVIYDGCLAVVTPVMIIGVMVSILLIFGCAKTFRAEDYL